MIEAADIVKKFTRPEGMNKKRTVTAVDGVSLTVGEGETVVILGANGAGKTTLLRILSGIMRQDSGTVSVDGMSYAREKIEIQKSIACLSGNTRLYSRITPREMMKMCGEIYGVEKAEADRRIEEICATLNMSAFADSRIASLSTGQTQRASIARCLVHDPKYYIFDEATTGLDVVSSQIILDFIGREKERGKGILYSTHYMEEAEKICDRAVMLDCGRVIASGTVAEICKSAGADSLREAFFSLNGGDTE